MSPVNKLLLMDIFSQPYLAQSAGAIEYTGCIYADK